MSFPDWEQLMWQKKTKHTTACKKNCGTQQVTVRFKPAGENYERLDNRSEETKQAQTEQ